MCLRTKFQVPSIILTSFRQGVILPPTPTTKRTPKRPTQIRVNKVSGLRPATLLKKRLKQRCFRVNFVKFLRTPFSQNTSRRLFLFVIHLTVSFCKEVLYICSNLLLLEKSTKTYNLPSFHFANTFCALYCECIL